MSSLLRYVDAILNKLFSFFYGAMIVDQSVSSFVGDCKFRLPPKCLRRCGGGGNVSLGPVLITQ
jgi:hypothetical protein